MMHRTIFAVIISLTFFVFTANYSLADDASVLPKGISSFGVNSNFYFPVDERYDPIGDTENPGVNFNGVLDSTVFPDLELLESILGMPAGSANLGTSVVSFEYDFKVYEIKYSYGLTDRLTFGIKVPYWDVKNTVSAELDATNATVGANPYLGTPGDPFLGSPVAPIALGGVPLTTDQVQDFLVQQFGYNRLETWSDTGFSDIEAGLKYQYFTNKDWRLAFTGGLRLPTGDVDNIDHLADYGFGTGTWGIGFFLHQDYIGLKHIVFNTTFRYKLYLEKEEELRVPADVDEPLTENKEKVDRDLGDVIELEASGKYQFLNGWSLSLLYKYGFASKTKVSGNMGYNYNSLEDETDWEEHVGIIGLSYSTIPLYQQKKFSVPLTASVSYRNRFYGKNNVLKSEYIGFGLDVYF